METDAGVEPRKLTGRPPRPGQKSSGKSRLSNGHGVLLDNVDGRSAMYRRYRDICGAIIADSGGVSECSESRQHLIRRFAAAAVLAEQMESHIVNGESVDIAAFAQLSSTLVRIVNHLGLERIPRVIGSSFVGEVIDGNVELPERPSWSSPLRDAMARTE